MSSHYKIFIIYKVYITHNLFDAYPLNLAFFLFFHPNLLPSKNSTPKREEKVFLQIGLEEFS